MAIHKMQLLVGLAHPQLDQVAVMVLAVEPLIHLALVVVVAVVTPRGVVVAMAMAAAGMAMVMAMVMEVMLLLLVAAVLEPPSPLRMAVEPHR